jgi:hypothetical protein
MVQSLSPPHAAGAPLDDALGLQSATCPMCHTDGDLTQAALDAGGSWQCVRCGHHWNAVRLATSARYAAWVVDRGGAGTLQR